jgi:hypothetical protein
MTALACELSRRGRACNGNDGRLERCDQCSFDLREAVLKGHPTNSRKLQEILDIQLRCLNRIAGKPKGEYFAVLRHLIDGAGLKDLRSVACDSRSMALQFSGQLRHRPVDLGRRRLCDALEKAMSFQPGSVHFEERQKQ